MPVCTSKTSECWNECSEDAEEHNIRPQGADHVDEAQDAHPEQEEGKAGVEFGLSESFRNDTGCRIETIGIVEWRKSAGEAEPEGTE